MTCRGTLEVLGHVLPHLFQVAGTRLARAFLPGEDADGCDAVEPDPGQRAEELVPADLALADVEVLMRVQGKTG